PSKKSRAPPSAPLAERSMDAVAMRCVYRKTPNLDRAQFERIAGSDRRVAEHPIERIRELALVPLRLDTREEVPGVERLAQEFADPEVHGRHPRLHLGGRGEENHRDAAGPLAPAERRANLQAVEVGHNDVEDDD